MEKEKKKSKLPNDFFTKERKEITIKEALKDIIPVNWTKTKRQTKKNATLSKRKDLSLN